MELLKAKQVQKAWGEEIWLVNNEKYCGKRLILKKGKRCSLHYHKEKDETFYIHDGRVLMEAGGKTIIMNKGDAIRLKPMTTHRFSGIRDSVIIGVSTHHDDEDSYRTEEQIINDIPQEIMEKYS